MDQSVLTHPYQLTTTANVVYRRAVMQLDISSANRNSDKFIPFTFSTLVTVGD